MPPKHWSQFPEELLVIISEKITSIRDYVRCRLVCRNWRSAIPPHPRHLPPQFPWLMLPAPPDENPRRFYDLSRRKTYQLHLPPQLLTDETSFCGSSQGWLVLQDPDTFAVSLVNPVTGYHIPLPLFTRGGVNRLCYPPIGDGVKQGIEHVLEGPYPSHRRVLDRCKKAVLSSPPSSGSDCVVMANFAGLGGTVAFCRVGDTSWTILEELGTNTMEGVWDVTCHGGRFCTVSSRGRVILYDAGPPWKAKIYWTEHRRWELRGWDYLSLVENPSRDLLVVASKWLPVRWGEKKLSASLYRLCFDEKLRWLEMNSIPDSMIIYGHGNQCFLFSASNFDGDISMLSASYLDGDDFDGDDEDISALSDDDGDISGDSASSFDGDVWNRICFHDSFFGHLSSCGIKSLGIADGSIWQMTGRISASSLEAGLAFAIWITPSLCL